MTCRAVHLMPIACLALFAGCAGDQERSPSSPQSREARPTAPATPASGTKAAPGTPTAHAGKKAKDKAIRIDAGSETDTTDADGNLWLADDGFDGDIVDRGAIPIANTANPAIYRTEHWDMTSFLWPVANGTYTVRMHFAETYDGIAVPEKRIFSVAVEGGDPIEIDVVKEAGGPKRAWIKTVKAVVADGQLDIAFDTDEEPPIINGIEIIPLP